MITIYFMEMSLKKIRNQNYLAKVLPIKLDNLFK